MRFLPRFTTDQKANHDRAAPGHPFARKQVPAKSLPRELVEAPAWLLDDLGLPYAADAETALRKELDWQMLVRKLG